MIKRFTIFTLSLSFFFIDYTILSGSFEEDIRVHKELPQELFAVSELVKLCGEFGTRVEKKYLPIAQQNAQSKTFFNFDEDRTSLQKNFPIDLKDRAALENLVIGMFQKILELIVHINKNIDTLKYKIAKGERLSPGDKKEVIRKNLGLFITFIRDIILSQFTNKNDYNFDILDELLEEIEADFKNKRVSERALLEKITEFFIALEQYVFIISTQRVIDTSTDSRLYNLKVQILTSFFASDSLFVKHWRVINIFIFFIAAVVIPPLIKGCIDLKTWVKNHFSNNVPRANNGAMVNPAATSINDTLTSIANSIGFNPAHLIMASTSLDDLTTILLNIIKDIIGMNVFGSPNFLGARIGVAQRGPGNNINMSHVAIAGTMAFFNEYFLAPEIKQFRAIDNTNKKITKNLQDNLSKKVEKHLELFNEYGGGNGIQRELSTEEIKKLENYPELQLIYWMLKNPLGDNSQTQRTPYLVGEPGTGKTTLATWLAECSGRRYIVIKPTMNPELVNALVDAARKTIPGPTLFILDELPELIANGVVSVPDLLRLIDPASAIDESDDDTTRFHGIQFIATGNPAEMTGRINFSPALKDRFRIIRIKPPLLPDRLNHITPIVQRSSALNRFVLGEGLTVNIIADETEGLSHRDIVKIFELFRNHAALGGSKTISLEVFREILTQFDENEDKPLSRERRAYLNKKKQYEIATPPTESAQQHSSPEILKETKRDEAAALQNNREEKIELNKPKVHISALEKKNSQPSISRKDIGEESLEEILETFKKFEAKKSTSKTEKKNEPLSTHNDQPDDTILILPQEKTHKLLSETLLEPRPLPHESSSRPSDNNNHTSAAEKIIPSKQIAALNSENRNEVKDEEPFIVIAKKPTSKRQ